MTRLGLRLAMASALRKIERATLALHGPLATLYVRRKEGDPLAELFSTHSDTEGRIERPSPPPLHPTRWPIGSDSRFQYND